MPRSPKVVSYVRDMTITVNKFADLDRLCREAEGMGAGAVLVTSPNVLGDDYGELIANLDKIARAKLSLIILPPKERVDPQAN